MTTIEPVAWMDREGGLYKELPTLYWYPPYTPLYAAPQPQPDHFRDATEKVQPCNPAEDGVCEALECCKQLREQNTMLDAEAAKDEALLRQALVILERLEWQREDTKAAIAALRERLEHGKR